MRSLERLWPFVVEVRYRGNAIKYITRYNRNKFPLTPILKEGIQLQNIPNEFGMRLVPAIDKKLTPEAQRLYEEWQRYEESLNQHFPETND